MSRYYVEVRIREHIDGSGAHDAIPIMEIRERAVTIVPIKDRAEAYEAYAAGVEAIKIAAEV